MYNVMYVIYRSADVKQALTVYETAVAIGNFDGVHVGHQALIKRLDEVSREKTLYPVVLTFEPHPKALFSPGDPLPKLTTLRDKIALLFELGVEAVFIQRFDAAFSQLDVRPFIERVIFRQLLADHMVIGDDFYFGPNRALGGLDLKRAAAEWLVDVDIVNTVSVDDHRVSSTDIRQLLQAGNLEGAARLLGRPYCFTGRVISGKQLGRNIGFPTLNIQIKEGKLPVSGIIIVTVRTAAAVYRGVANAGENPTVDDSRQLHLEIHILDHFTEEIYGQRVTVQFLEKIRDEQKFDTITQLVGAITEDCHQAITYFNRQGNYEGPKG